MRKSYTTLCFLAESCPIMIFGYVVRDIRAVASCFRLERRDLFFTSITTIYFD